MKETNGSEQNPKREPTYTSGKSRGNWWSKKKVLAIALSGILLLLCFQVYEVFSNQKIEAEELDVKPEEVISGTPVLVTFNVRNTTKSEGLILSCLKKFSLIWNFLNNEFAPTREINLEIDGEIYGSRSVTLGINEIERLSFQINLGNGTHEVLVDNLSESFEVFEPAKFEGGNLVIEPSEIMLGEGAKLLFEIQNTGDVEGEKTIKIKVDGTTKEKTIRLEAGEEKRISFNLDLKHEGTHVVKVSGLSESLEGVIEVRNPVNNPLDYPEYYYSSARNYLASNYELPEEKNIQGLADFLNQVSIRPYSRDYFDCSEMSTIIEWMLEGAGFRAEIALNYSLKERKIPKEAHSWIMVDLGNQNEVAVETTYLAEGNYFPPGIVEAPNGSYKEYSYVTYYNKTHSTSLISDDESMKQELYNPCETYESPKDLIEGGTTYYVPKEELDWWNVSPYNSIEPFSSWN